jgi:hypothetical protein
MEECGLFAEPGEEQEQQSALSMRLDIDLVSEMRHILNIYIVLSRCGHSCNRILGPSPISPGPNLQDI